MSIGKNTALGLATDIIMVLLGLVVSIVLARGLEADGRGVYAWLATTNVLLTNLGHLSVIGACSTMLARGRYRLGEINTAALLLALVLGLIFGGGTLALYLPLRDSLFKGINFQYLLVALLLTPVTIYQSYWNYMMMGLSNIVLMNKLNLTVNVVSTVLMITVVGILRLGIPGFLGVWLFTGLLGMAIAITASGRIERFSWPPRRIVLKDMLQFGARSHGANIAHYLFLRFDAYAVNTLVGRTGLGIYSLSTSLAERMWLPLNAMHASSINKITQLPHDESALLAARITRTALMLMVGLAVPFAIISPWLVPFLYGAQFAGAVLPLCILLVGTIGFAVMLVLNSYILGQMERPGLLSIISWLELLVSIPLYIVLVSYAGIVGAAIASTLTYLLAMVLTITIFVRDSHLPVYMVLVPRREDFREYGRLIRLALDRVPVIRGYTGKG